MIKKALVFSVTNPLGNWNPVNPGFFIRQFTSYFYFSPYLCTATMTQPIKKNIAILGSTGSIGKQALDIVKANPDKLQLEVLSAQNNADLLIAQAIEFSPNAVVIGEEEKEKGVEW